MDTIIFVTKNSNNFYKIELSKTLLHFAEYDFTYFWEQSIALGKSSRVTGSYDYKQFSIIKNLISKCHPYFEAQINSDFENIVLDCIIEYICHSENIGLEELWARCITPKNGYERAIFSRISEYKTNRAINQWANLVRIQDYAKNKLSYIFDGAPATKNTYKARKCYFDLTFSVAAKELGFPAEDLPSNQSFNAALMPNSPFMISKVSKVILKQISEIVDNAREPVYSHINDMMRDQIGLDAFSYVKNLPRPEDMDLNMAKEAFQALADEIYMPNSFKAAVDLEFDKMVEREVFLQKCEKCGKYYLQDGTYIGKYCNRVNATGKTCREQFETEKKADDQEISDIRKRSDRIYRKLKKRIGDGFEEREFKEWAQYLQNMQENVRNDVATKEDLEAFLDYSEKLYGEVKKNAVKSKPQVKVPETSSAPKQIVEPEMKAPVSSSEPKPYRFPTLAELEERDAKKSVREPSDFEYADFDSM